MSRLSRLFSITFIMNTTDKTKEVTDEIQALLESEITNYKISKATGIHQTTVAKLRKQEISLEEMRFKTVIALYQFAVTVSNS